VEIDPAKEPGAVSLGRNIIGKCLSNVDEKLELILEDQLKEELKSNFEDHIKLKKLRKVCEIKEKPQEMEIDEESKEAAHKPNVLYYISEASGNQKPLYVDTSKTCSYPSELADLCN
jgi:hypothetical protein